MKPANFSDLNKLFTAKNLAWLAIFFTPAYFLKLYFFSLPFNFLELLIILNLIALVVEKNHPRLIFNSIPKKYLLLIPLLILGLLVSMAINYNFRPGLGIIKSWFIFPLILAFIVKTEFSEKKSSVLSAIFLSALAVSIIGIIYIFIGRTTFDGRLSAFYPSPNYLAMFLAPGIIIGVSCIMYHVSCIKNFKFESASWRTNLKLFFFIASFSIILFSFYLTYSYAAWISAATSIALVAIIEKINKKNFLQIASFRLLTLIMAIFVLAAIQWNNPKFQDLITLNERSSLASRVMIWKSAAKMAADNPVFGIGPGSFQNKYLEYQKYFPPYLEWAVPQPHNLYLAFWLQAGILGLLSFVFIMFAWLKDLIKKIRLGGDYELKIILAIMIYILLHGLVDTTYWKNDLAVIFWTVFVLGAAEKSND